MATLQERVEAEPYWFLKMDLGNGVVTPGWSDPVRDKLPWFGLPDDMTGLRVLDVGCAEGFFSFEAERRGAAEVVSVDFEPKCIRRFELCAEALGSKVTHPQVLSVYKLDPALLGTFDLVMFFGLLYHLEHPLMGIKRVAAMTSGTLLVASVTIETNSLSDQSLARFHPHGVMSRTRAKPVLDRTVYWEPNAACIRDMLDYAGLANIEQLPGPQAPLKQRVARHVSVTAYGMEAPSSEPRRHIKPQARLPSPYVRLHGQTYPVTAITSRSAPNLKVYHLARPR